MSEGSVTAGERPGSVLRVQAAALAGVTLVMVGLYGLGAAEAWAQRAARVEVATWSARCASIAAIATGQVLFAWFVLPGVSRRARRGWLGTAYGVAFALVAVLALVGAVATGLAAGW